MILSIIFLDGHFVETDINLFMDKDSESHYIIFGGMLISYGITEIEENRLFAIHTVN